MVKAARSGSNHHARWFPEIFLGTSVYRVERARQKLWHKLRLLLPKNSIIKANPALVFERAVFGEFEARRTPVTFVYLNTFPEDTSGANELLTHINSNKEAISNWISAVFPDKLSKSGSPHNRLLQTLQTEVTPEDCRRVFADLVEVYSGTEVYGYISACATDAYFSRTERPVGFYGRLGSGKAPEGQVAEIEKSFTAVAITPDLSVSQEVIKSSSESAHSIHGLPTKTRDDQKRFAVPFSTLVLGLVHRHRPLKTADIKDYLIFLVPVFSMNGSLDHTGNVSSSYGTFIGWLYFLWEPPQSNSPKGASFRLPNDATEVLRMLLPLLDDFALEILASTSTDVIDEVYQNSTPSPYEFLNNYLGKLSGWTTRQGEQPQRTPQSNALFVWAESEGRPCLTIALDGDVIKGYTEPFTLFPRASTAIPAEDEGKHNFGSHMAYQIRAIYREARSRYELSRAEELQKYRQMFELLESPLDQISAAIGRIQTGTQALRAVIYEPSIALFGFHHLLSDLFTEKKPIKVSQGVTIEISHNGSYDGSDADKVTGQVVMCLALCLIFGRADELQHHHTPLGIIDHTKHILGQIENSRNDPFRELCKDLRWLFRIDLSDTAPPQDTPNTEQLNSDMPAVSSSNIGQNVDSEPALALLLDRDNISDRIKLLKETLFAPFKLHSKTWNLRAIELAIRSTRIRNTPKVDGNKEPWEIPVSCNPCPYNALLAFVSGIVGNLASRTDPIQIESLKFSRNETRPSWDIDVLFGEQWFFEEEDQGNLPHLIHRHLLTAPRDWRIEATNAGNFHKPFIDLAGRLLGISATNNTPEAWHIWNKRAARGAINLLCVKRGDRGFLVQAIKVGKLYKTLRISWIKTKTTSDRKQRP